MHPPVRVHPETRASAPVLPRQFPALLPALLPALVLLTIPVLPSTMARAQDTLVWRNGLQPHPGGVVEVVLPPSLTDIQSLSLPGGVDAPLQRGLDGRLRMQLPPSPAGGQLVARPRRLPAPPGPATPRIEARPGHQWALTADTARIVFQAEPGAFPRPDIAPLQRRGGYVAAVYTPSGTLVTDDFPPKHIHHHGVWSAWTRTRFEDRQPDFWNLHLLSGRVDFAGLLETTAGPVLAGLRSRKTQVDLGVAPPRPVLDEHWILHLHPPLHPPGSAACTVFDLEVSQQNVTASPLHLPAYHYGGLGVRGHRDWDGPTACRFLTSNGETHRIRGNGTRARWTWMGGQVDGRLAGIAILDHPANPRAPQPVRLHPDEPFFCYSPPAAGDLQIAPGNTWIARYRFIAFDGEPDASLLDHHWEAFAQPVAWVAGSPP